MNISTANLKQALTTCPWRETCQTCWRKSNGPKRTTLRRKRSPERVRRWPESCCSPADCTVTTTECCTCTQSGRQDSQHDMQTWRWCRSRTTTLRCVRVSGKATKKKPAWKMNYDGVRLEFLVIVIFSLKHSWHVKPEDNNNNNMFLMLTRKCEFHCLQLRISIQIVAFIVDSKGSLRTDLQ